MDLGSALMSAEIALEMLEDGGPVALSAAPLVEGAVAAAARARGGDSLADVAAEARGALVMKTSQLEEVDAPPEAARRREAAGDAVVERLPCPTASACTCARRAASSSSSPRTTRRSSCATRRATRVRRTAAA